MGLPLHCPMSMLFTCNPRVQLLCVYYYSVVRELVKQNRMVVNDEDEDSNTALHLAALAGHNKVVQALIENGADIEARYQTTGHLCTTFAKQISLL